MPWAGISDPPGAAAGGRSLNVSAREGALPSVAARRRQRPGFQRQSLSESFSKLQKNSETSNRELKDFLN